VGSKNPDRMVVSLYSNTGSWVSTYRPGTAVVSTMPETFNASSRQQVLRLGPTNPARGLVDDDDFSTGFGVWSGTSFAAPAFAADIAQQLAPAADPAAKSVPLKDVKQAVGRALEDTKDNRRFDAGGGS
jgi:serine protease